MKQSHRAYITSIGMVTSIGANTSATVMAVRAGISRFENSSVFSHSFKPIKLATIPDEALPELSPEVVELDKLTQRQARMIQAMSVALTECLQGRNIENPIPMFLSLPEPLPGLSSGEMAGMLKKIALQSQMPINLEDSRQFPMGRAGGINAFQLAQDYLNQTGDDFALVAGIDSPFDHSWLAYLDSQNRVLREGAKDAFAAGEAAACILVASQTGLSKLGTPNAIWYDAPGLATEEGHRFSEQPYRGEGLSSAVQQALEYQSPEILVEDIYSTLNGESFGVKELGVSKTRNSSAMAENVSIHHPADCFGDLGAAFAPTLAGLAAYDLASKKTKGISLVLASSETQYRGALCLQRENK